jgi:hypothetical protein
VRARLALALLPEGEVLAKTGSDLCTARRMPVDLEEAENRRDASQEAKAGALCVARGVGIVADVGVLGVPGDFVLDDGAARGIQGFLTDLLGELAILATRERSPSTFDGM